MAPEILPDGLCTLPFMLRQLKKATLIRDGNSSLN